MTTGASSRNRLDRIDRTLWVHDSIKAQRQGLFTAVYVTHLTIAAIARVSLRTEGREPDAGEIVVTSSESYDHERFSTVGNYVWTRVYAVNEEIEIDALRRQRFVRGNRCRRALTDIRV